MTLKEYQERAMTTCLPHSKNVAYMLLNLVGEVGEIAGKVSKVIRNGEAHFTGYGNIGFNKTEPEIEEGLKKEVGDVLWQLSGLCSVMGWSLEDIAQQNLDKLADRQQRGVIASQGDNR